jgi:hypothetical protein
MKGKFFRNNILQTQLGVDIDLATSVRRKREICWNWFGEVTRLFVFPVAFYVSGKGDPERVIA